MISEKISEEILNSVAPCSMFCSTCTGCNYGDISYHAKELLRLLNGHEEFLDKNLKEDYRHKLDEFRLFKHKLEKYAAPKCGGCRSNRVNSCCIENCIIPSCVESHGVNFCADCVDFPCNIVNESIYKKSTINKWLEGNQEIKEIGIQKYYVKNKNKPHYINYVK